MTCKQSDLAEIEELLDAATTAPAFGLNSRTLILRAARRTVSQPGRRLLEDGSPPPEQRPTETCTENIAPLDTAESAKPDNMSGLLAEELVKSLSVQEKPLVQYIPRSAVPRIVRQVIPQENSFLISILTPAITMDLQHRWRAL